MKNDAARLPDYPWLEIARPAVPLGRVRYALFDFDGTLSVIRRGWEQIMIAVMLESIYGGQSPDPQIEAEVTQYVDESTGVLTIKQMKWLEEVVRLHGISLRQRTASEYKRLYSERLLHPVSQRLALLDGGQEDPDLWMVTGARDFLQQLANRGVKLFLASGTDQEYVEQEARALGILDYFGDQVYGAKGDSETDSKALVMQRILTENSLKGEELLVVGDGPVEIRAARLRGAVALGVATNELDRSGLDPRKCRRLLNAGADMIVTHFLHSAELVDVLVGPVG